MDELAELRRRGISPHDPYINHPTQTAAWVARAERRKQKREAKIDLDDLLAIDDPDRDRFEAMHGLPRGDDHEPRPLRPSFVAYLMWLCRQRNDRERPLILQALDALRAAGPVERTWALVVLLCACEGQTQATAAKEIGVSQSTVSERLAAGLGWIAEWLGEQIAGNAGAQAVPAPDTNGDGRVIPFSV